MKLQIITVLAFVISITTFAQTEIEKPFEYKYESLEHLKGSVVVMSILDIRNDNKTLDKLIKTYKTDKVTFIVITDNINEETYNMLKGKFPLYKCLSIEENEIIFNTYQTGVYKTFPIQIILNKDGKAKYIKKGATNNIERKLKKRIDRLINKT